MSEYADVTFLPRITAQQVSDLYARRRLAAGPEQARMQEVQQMVNGEIVVPLPELSKNERSSVPNRAKQGLQQFAQRIASAPPNVVCPPLRYGVDLSEKKAHNRRKAILGWWEHSRMNLQLRQRARYLQGYASSPVHIYWDAEDEVPCYEPVNPLYFYPAPMRGVWEMCPPDAIVEQHQSLRWLNENYPMQTAMLYKGPQDVIPRMDDLYCVLKYADEYECVLVALGKRNEDDYQTPPPGSMAVELDRYENRAGTTPYVIPRMICLDKLQGQFDGIMGMHMTEAVLQALAVQATRKGVFQEPWLVARPGEEPAVEDVPHIAADGNMTPGVLKGGDLQWENVSPQFQTNLTIDRLAAAQNETAGLTSELQGVAGSNIRTGARANALLSNVIDFPIQEAQELLAESLQEENKKAIAFCKAYSGPKKFYVSWPGAQGEVTYDPSTTFETDRNLVSYPLAGADQAGLVISSGQRLGMGTMSKHKFMEIDPLVADPEQEHDRIIVEKLEEAQLMALGQMVASGGMDPLHLAAIAKAVVTDKAELFDAIAQADEAAKAAQAQQAPPGAPETQPGLAAPPQPGAQAPPNEQGLAALLASLRRPQTGVTPQEQGAQGIPA